MVEVYRIVDLMKKPLRRSCVRLRRNIGLTYVDLTDPTGKYPLGSLVACPLSWMQGARHVLRCSFRFTRRMVKSGLVEPSEPVDRLNFLREFPTHPFRQGPLD